MRRWFGVNGETHALTITKAPRRAEWACETCGRKGVTTRGFEGQDLVAKVRVNHYQRVRRAAAKHP